MQSNAEFETGSAEAVSPSDAADERAHDEPLPGSGVISMLRQALPAPVAQLHVDERDSEKATSQSLRVQTPSHAAPPSTTNRGGAASKGGSFATSKSLPTSPDHLVRPLASTSSSSASSTSSSSASGGDSGSAQSSSRAPQSLEQALRMLEQKDDTIAAQTLLLDMSGTQIDQLHHNVAAAAPTLAQMRAQVDSALAHGGESSSSSTSSAASSSSGSSSASSGSSNGSCSNSFELDAMRRDLQAMADRLERAEREATDAREAHRNAARQQKRADDAERVAAAARVESETATARLQQLRATADDKIAAAQRAYLESQTAVGRLEAELQETRLGKTSAEQSVQRLEAEAGSQRALVDKLQENLATAREDAAEKMRAYLDVVGQKKVAEQNLSKVTARDEQSRKELEQLREKAEMLAESVRELQPFRAEAENSRRAVARLSDENKAFKVQLFDLQQGASARATEQSDEVERLKAELAEALNFTEQLMEENEELKGSAAAPPQ